MRRALTVTLCGFGLALLPATGAAADGGPVQPMQGGVGASTPGSPVNFVAVGAGVKHTILERIRRGSGMVERSRVIDGFFGVPSVAFDGSTTGLSADGRTLVLAEYAMRYPPKSTGLLVLDPSRFRQLSRVTLPGMASVDAISPDGRWLYLTRYKDPTATNYEVLAYDLQQHKLIDKPIVDPREPDEKMQGQPVTRLMSADGRWAYTLYSRGPEAPFIHALDTANRTAACVDLPLSTNLDQVFEMRLRFGPRGALQVTHNGNALADVDTRTFAVSQPAAPKPVPKPAADRADGGSRFPWALGVLPTAVLLAGLGVLARRRRRLRSAPA
jgi:hypothetical protein